MATREDLMQALRAADAAGDAAAATAIAKRLSSASAAPGAGQGSPATAQAQPEDAKPFVRAGGYGAGSAGVNDAVIKSYLGAKQFFGGLSHEEQGVLRAMAEEKAADPEPKMRLAGDIGGNIAMTAVPGSKVAQVLSKTLSAAKYVPQMLVPALTGAAVSGGQGVALTPGEGEGFGEQMSNKAKSGGFDALLGAGIPAVGQVLKKTLTKPFEATKEALDLFRQGINPTLQQAADSKIGRFIGGLTSGVVDVSGRQNKEVLDAMLKKIAPAADLTDMNVPEKVALLRRQFLGDGGTAGEFDNLLAGKKFTMSQPERSAIWAAARGPRGTLPDATTAATGAMGDTGPAMTSSNPVSMGPKTMQQYRELLQDAIDKFPSQDGVVNRQARDNLVKARGRFDDLVRNKSLSAEEQAQLADIDQRYQDFLRYQDAAKSPGFHAKPRAGDVMRSYANMDEGGVGFATAASPMQKDLLEPASRVMGMNPTQDESRSLLSAGKRILKGTLAAGAGAGAAAGNPFALAAVPAYGISLAGQTAGGSRALFGETAIQKMIAENMRKMAPYSYGLGQTLGGEQ